MTPDKVNIAEKLSLFDEHRSPELVVVPRGAEQRPASAANTGSAGGGMTVVDLNRI